ncbi:hypothetical protein TrLO_g762 [Triparma laevis f. longispina]|uniref:Uncharacterized protein n=1 Tax=Triparma laevis f. longispina TaxID=1714387 RepID=A0A9W7C5Z4_9STRA|nr:hypothetical protein TrLO_g762 [Triparma laevis f. longispina]
MTDEAGNKTPATPDKQKTATQRRRLSTADLSTRLDEEVVRVLEVQENYKETMLMDSKATVMAGMFGERVSNMTWRFLRITKFSYLFAALWTIACFLMVPIFLGFLPPEFGLVAFIIGVISPVQNVCFMNRHLLRLLLNNFEIWFLSVLSTMWAVAMFDVLGDARAGCIVLTWVSIVFIVLPCDASPRTSYHMVLYGNGIGVVMFPVMGLCFHFGIFTNLHNRVISLSGVGTDVEITVSNIMFANQRLFTVWLFFCKNMHAAWKHPGSFSMLKARLTSKKTTIGEMRKEREENNVLSITPKISSLTKRSTQVVPIPN